MNQVIQSVRCVCLPLLALLAWVPAAGAATISASSCSQSDVQAALTAASGGDTVMVPAGTCSWTSLAISKGIRLIGAGASATNITVTGVVSVRRVASHGFELSGFSFRKTNDSSEHMFLIDGASDAAMPLIHDNVFTVSNSGIIRYETNGGVIYGNTFNGDLDDSGIQHKLISDDNLSWRTLDTMGVRDTDGRSNLYIEDNAFNGMANQALDFDDSSRVVFRHNVLTSSSVNSHGRDTSPVGVRHYEIYANQFRYPDSQVNQVWMIWLRGGTGVIYDNAFDDIRGQMWGDKIEIRMSVRAADEGGVDGCCTVWPCRRQVGQTYAVDPVDGREKELTDGVRFWGNAGNPAWELARWENRCGNDDITVFLREGRDFAFSTSPKPGYSPFPYPHPVRADAGPRPLPPTGIFVQ